MVVIFNYKRKGRNYIGFLSQIVEINGMLKSKK